MVTLQKENEMNDLTLNEVGMTELSMEEIDDVSGGVLCLLVLAFAGGYGVGTMIYNKMMK